MEPVFVNVQRFCPTHLVSTLAVSLGLSLLAGCSSLPTDNLSQQNAPLASSPAETAAEFTFPQTNCGDQSTQPSGTWYVVYLDGANPDEVRREYCHDAIGTVRDGSGVPTVQVASFIDYNKALRFAAAVGGEVEATTYSQSPSPNQQSPNAASPGATGAAGSTASLVGRTAYLSAKDAGSTINVRVNPSLSAPIQLTGKVGEPVRVADRMQGEDGNTWYKVAFETGQEGWVRSDFIADSLASTATSSPSATTNGYSSYNPNAYGAAGSGSGVSGTGSTNGAASGAAPSSANNFESNEANRYNASISGGDSGDRYSSPDAASTEPSSANSSDGHSAAEADPPPTTGEDVVLTAHDPGSRINIRSDASTSAQISHAGYPGDAVEVTDIAQGEDGYTWYNIRFESGVTGWVRGDFIEER